MLLTTSRAYAQSITFTGVTGPLSTPDALIAPTASFVYQFNEFMEQRFADENSQGRNHVFTLGVFKRLELGGRLTDFDAFGPEFDVNGFQTGRRDLSGNIKVNLLDAPDLFAFSVGAIDFAGLAQNFSSTYGVASFIHKGLTLSGGVAGGDNPTFNGFFASVNYDVNRFFSLRSELDTSGNVNAGAMGKVRIGSRLSLNASIATIDSDFSAGIGFSYLLRSPEFQPITVDYDATEASIDASENTTETTDDLIDLRNTLARDGFQNIRLGQRGDDEVVLDLENKLFYHSDYDALTQARYRANEKLGEGTTVNLALLQQGIPKFRIRFDTPSGRAEPVLAVESASQRNDTAWLPPSGFYNRSWADFSLEPQLVSAIGTEVGLVDFSLAARVGVAIPLWRGAKAVAKYVVPLAESDNFDTGGVFERSAFKSTLERVLLVQYFPLFNRVHTQVELGKIDIRGFNYTAAKVQGTWESRKLPIRLHATAGQYRLDDANVTRNVVTGTVAYTSLALDSVFSATYGQFFFRETAIRLNATRRFGNIYATAFLKIISDDDLAGGLQFSAPIGPRKGWQWSRFTFTGTSRWFQALQTTIKFPDADDNRLQPALLIEPLADSEIPLRVLDSGRLNNYEFNWRESH
ncbi:hypothetical protein OAM69_06000 [bacterium]|nr:hypothetical protein [bacterium]